MLCIDCPVTEIKTPFGSVVSVSQMFEIWEKLRAQFQDLEICTRGVRGLFVNIARQSFKLIPNTLWALRKHLEMICYEET